ncbi:MAG TPA: hypothetical protein VMN81_09135 [Vicinamibacterales bacterium]|nr:hypothetical protein [Vicinamibacterales bacterium]
MKKLLLVLLLTAAFNAVPTAAFADCFGQLSDCFHEAAKLDSWVDRWLAGLDCELNFIECTRIKLVGG